MELLARSVRDVVSVSVIMGILLCICPKESTGGKLIRLMGGLLITLTLVSRFSGFEISGAGQWLEEPLEAARQAAAQGQEAAEEEKRGIIKSQLEAYILDKAEELGLALDVEVSLSDDALAVPEEVILEGRFSASGRRRLSEILCDELEIAKEKQLWIGAASESG